MIFLHLKQGDIMVMKTLRTSEAGKELFVTPDDYFMPEAAPIVPSNWKWDMLFWNEIFFRSTTSFNILFPFKHGL